MIRYVCPGSWIRIFLSRIPDAGPQHWIQVRCKNNSRSTTLNCYQVLGNMIWDVYPGSGFKKHQIPDLDPQHCETVWIRIDIKIRVPVSKLRAEVFKAQEILMCFQGPSHFRDNNFIEVNLYSTTYGTYPPTSLYFQVGFRKKARRGLCPRKPRCLHLAK